MQQCRNTINDVAPTAELLSHAFHHNILTTKHIADKLGIHPIILFRKMWTICMAKTSNNYICSIFS